MSMRNLTVGSGVGARRPHFQLCSAHGLWTFSFRASEAGSRLLGLAIFTSGFRGWIVLLILCEALLFSFLNLCDKCGHADADNPEGDHVSSRDHALYILVRRRLCPVRSTAFVAETAPLPPRGPQDWPLFHW